MKFLYLIAVWQLTLDVAIAEDTPPNPYQIFAQEQPEIYRIPTNQSSRVKGDKLPDLSRRASTLRPGAIPADVRYAFAADSSVADAATLLRNHFCGLEAHEGHLFSK